MLGRLFAIDDRFATRRDRVRIVETDRQGVHVRLLRDIDPARLVEVEFQRLGVRRLEEHARPIAHDAVMGQGQLAVLPYLNKASALPIMSLIVSSGSSQMNSASRAAQSRLLISSHNATPLTGDSGGSGVSNG